MCALLLRMEHLNDWDLQAVVRSCTTFSSHPQDRAGPPPGTAAAPVAETTVKREPRDVVRPASAAAKDAASLYGLEYLDLDHKPFLLSAPSSQSWAAVDTRHETMISFPAAAATSGVRPRVPPGRKPGIRSSTPRTKRSKKSQLKKVVCEVPVADGGVSSDLWAWRKYGQKPIKGSPYPRFFKKQHDRQVWISLMLMIISAIAGGVTDLSFHAVGYTWQILNCFLTASYSLTLRHVMDSAKEATRSGNLNELSMVLLNNVLSLPLGVILVLGFNEVEYLLETPLLRMPTFWLVITASGVLGLAISFTSMWFLRQTSATTYSLVGSLNKIPLSIAGILLFKVRTSMENSISILFGLLAGVFFARAKLRESSQS